MYIILYPTHYNKRGNTALHSIHGMDSEGRFVKVKLKPRDTDQQHPTIAELSDVDLNSTYCCESHPDNNKDNRYGVLLCINCEREQSNRRHTGLTYSTRQIVVLCQRRTDAGFLKGIGRIQINRGTDESIELEATLSTATDARTRKALLAQKRECVAINFSAIIYQFSDIRRFRHSTTHQIRSFVQENIHKMASVGGSAGFAIRLINPKGLVDSRTYLECYQLYDTKLGAYEDPEATIDRLFKLQYLSELDQSDTVAVDLIPLLRVNCSPAANAFYTQPSQYRPLRTYFTTREYRSRLCDVILKTETYQNSADHSVLLVNRVYSCSQPLGHPMKLNIDGELTLPVAGIDDATQPSYMSSIPLHNASFVRGLTRNVHLFSSMVELTSKLLLPERIQNVQEEGPVASLSSPEASSPKETDAQEQAVILPLQESDSQQSKREMIDGKNQVSDVVVDNSQEAVLSESERGLVVDNVDPSSQVVSSNEDLISNRVTSIDEVITPMPTHEPHQAPIETTATIQDLGSINANKPGLAADPISEMIEPPETKSKLTGLAAFLVAKHRL